MRAPIRLVAGLSLLLAAAETVVGSETVASSPLKWSACKSASAPSDIDIIITPPYPTTDSTPTASSLIECTTIDVHLCYGGGVTASCANMTQSLRLSRLATATAANAPTLWLAHDPRYASETTLELMTRTTQFTTASINVYALDSRLFTTIFVAGATSSEPPCATLAKDYATRPLIDVSFLAAVANCTEWIQSHLGDGGIHAYSLDSAAQDMAFAMDAVQTQEKIPETSRSVYVYASGRATRVVQRMLSQAAATTTSVSVAGVILDSPPPTPAAEKPVGDVAARFLGACATDPLCSSKFVNVSLADALTQLYAWMDGNVTAAPSFSRNSSDCVNQLKTAVLDGARDLTASHGVRRLLAKVRRHTSDSGPLAIPALVHRVRRCNDDDKKKPEAFIDHASYVFQPDTKAATSMAAFVDTVVMASELWPTTPEPTREQLTESFRASLISDGLMLQQQPSYCAYSASKSTACQALYKPGVSLNSSLSLVYKPSAKATDTSPFANVDVLILASRLSTTGASTAATQLYDALLRQTTKAANRTLLMVQSDRLDEQQLNGALSSAEQRLLSGFLTGTSRGLSGAWLSSDLASFDWSSTAPSVVKVTSTLASSVSSVNFTMSSQHSWEWFSWAYPYEQYEGKPWESSWKPYDSSWTSTTYMAVLPLLVIAVGIAFAVMRSCCSCCSCSRKHIPPPRPTGAYRPPPYPPRLLALQQPVSPVPLAVLVYPPSAPDFPDETPQLFPSPSSHSQSELFGLQPMQWEADHANQYALSYTPRDRNTLLTEL